MISQAVSILYIYALKYKCTLNVIGWEFYNEDYERFFLTIGPPSESEFPFSPQFIYIVARGRSKI